MAKRKRQVIYSVLAGVLVVGVLWFSVVRLRRPALLGAAVDILHGVETGNGEVLYANAFPHEKKALGLTPEKLNALYNRLILPRLQGYRPVGSVQAILNPGSSQAIAWRHYKDSRGHSFDLSVSPWATPEGPKQLVLARLATAWIVEYTINRGLPADGPACIEARLEGIRHDRPVLESLGIYGMVNDDPSVPMQTWDQIEAGWTKALAKIRSGEIKAKTKEPRHNPGA